MMHVTYGEKGVFLDDETAEVLLEYAARLADKGHADTVDLNAVGPGGHEVLVTYLLDQGSTMMKESADAAFIIPDNTDAVAYMRDKMKSMAATLNVEPMDTDELSEMQKGFESLN